jgi:hypothetical protein
MSLFRKPKRNVRQRQFDDDDDDNDVNAAAGDDEDPNLGSILQKSI